MTCNHPGFSKGQRLESNIRGRTTRNRRWRMKRKCGCRSRVRVANCPGSRASRERRPFLKVLVNFQTFGVDVGKPPASKSWCFTRTSPTCRKLPSGRRAPTTTTVWVSPVKKVKRRASRFGSVELRPSFNWMMSFLDFWSQKRWVKIITTMK